MRAKPATPLLDLLFPPRCPLCGAGLAGQHGLCPECWHGLALPAQPACHLCQMPLPSAGHSAGEDEALICSACVLEPPAHHGVAAATLYNPTSRQLVLALKHRRKVALAPFMARLMAARLKGLEQHAIGPGWLVVPVPLHRWRLWARGFNQSALLAREVAHLLGAQALVDALHRHRRTPRLGGLGREEREAVMQGAITTTRRHAARLKGARIVLADDVLTSGATTRACIQALRKAGAAEVVVACFARVTGGALP